ncbi:putative RNase H-like nuclease [Paenibacillus sp. PvR052]|nr:putative RNase H-like nuclease [Paenibacillus sp. PvP091]MBP1168118.1 putative RNase H-like nuclease [Paenibacillus sp. PvR098]MBP2439146.1 putative RNase H-like nuclease [Paenibacillus sp. PvP052]
MFGDLMSLWEAYREAGLLLIDMLIGLAAATEPRRCDVLARQLLKLGRASSIFPAPVREVLTASDYVDANALQRRVSGRGLSRQSWALVPKIRSLDELRCRAGRGVRRDLKNE